MKKIDELKKELMHGDNKLIASISKVPLTTVNAIMCGNRRLGTPQGAKVLSAAQKLIESRKRLLQAANQIEPGLNFATNAA